MDAELELLDASLPGTLPVYPGISLAGRYVLTDLPPAHRGDGIKVISLPHSRIALIIGDVVGAGTIAPTTMARILTILRDRLQDGESALSALHHADRYAESAPVASGAKVAIAVISLTDGTVEYAGAGNPPPLLVGPSGVRPLSGLPSRPLGAGGQGVAGREQLASGEILVMHSDGLLTASGHGVGEGQKRLGHLLGSFARPGTPVRRLETDRTDELCRQLLIEVPRGGQFIDDVALLVAERTANPASFADSGPATANNAARVTARLEQWLDSIGAGLLDHLALRQAVTEITTNVVRHAYAHAAGETGELNIRADLHDEGLLQIDVRDFGAWRESTGAPGHGLILAGGLVDSMQLDRSPDGTVVTLRQALGRPLPVLQAGQIQLDGSSGSPVRQRPPTMDSRMAPGRLFVTGAVEDRCADEFQNRVHDLTRAGTEDAAIDLSEVTQLASSAVRILFDYMARSRASGARLSVLAASGSIAEQVLQLVDLPYHSV